MTQKKTSKWPLVIGFGFALLLLINAVIDYGQSERLVHAQHQFLKDNTSKIKKYKKQTLAIKDVNTADIRETTDFQKNR